MAAENLFCNELWLMNMMTTPTGAEPERDQAALHANGDSRSHRCTIFSYSDVEDSEEAFSVFLGKEMGYAPESDYKKHVRESCWVDKARFTAIHWFVKSQRRLNLSLETVFNAANYFDRFNSRHKSTQVWNEWMFELLSVACLSAASKFNETNPPSLDQIQMEGIENLFESSLIQRMELNLLKCLEWRLRPTTSFSCTELLTGSSNIDLFKFSNKEHLVREFNERVSDLLVNALLDSKFLEFWPSATAMSALQHISEQFVTKDDRDWFCTGRFIALFSPDQQEKFIKCYEMMKAEKLLDKDYNFSCNPSPCSPVTVLGSDTPWCSDFRDFRAACRDIPLLKIKNTSSIAGSPKKRKREEANKLIC